MKKYKIGVIEANKRSTLGMRTVEHCGLAAKPDRNIGRLCIIKEPTCISELYIYKIVGTQICWGHDENGKYVSDRPAYRLNKKGKDEFGFPQPKELIQFVHKDFKFSDKKLAALKEIDEYFNDISLLSSMPTAKLRQLAKAAGLKQQYIDEIK